MAAAAILDFAKICTLPTGIDKGWCQVHAFVIWLESLHPCGNYDGAHRHLGFGNFSLLPLWIDKG